MVYLWTTMRLFLRLVPMMLPLLVPVAGAQENPRLPRVVTNPARAFWEEGKTPQGVLQFKMV